VRDANGRSRPVNEKAPAQNSRGLSHQNYHTNFISGLPFSTM
jgi:hypothetical protein